MACILVKMNTKKKRCFRRFEVILKFRFKNKICISEHFVKDK